MIYGNPVDIKFKCGHVVAMRQYLGLDGKFPEERQEDWRVWKAKDICPDCVKDQEKAQSKKAKDDFDKRCALAQEITEAVSKRWPNVSRKYSAITFVDGDTSITMRTDNDRLDGAIVPRNKDGKIIAGPILRRARTLVAGQRKMEAAAAKERDENKARAAAIQRLKDAAFFSCGIRLSSKEVKLLVAEIDGLRSAAEDYYE